MDKFKVIYYSSVLFIIQIRTNGDEWIVSHEAFINIHGNTVGRVQHIAKNSQQEGWENSWQNKLCAVLCQL